MMKFVSLVILPSLIFAPHSTDKIAPTTQTAESEEYAIVSEELFDCYENSIPYTRNRDKKQENNEIRTLEERNEGGRVYEKKPYAKIDIAESVSGEEVNYGIESVIDMLDEKFGYMYALKAQLDAREKESAKMWSEYYAIKEVYDRAVAKYTEKWAEDNGILLAKKCNGMPATRFRMKK